MKFMEKISISNMADPYRYKIQYLCSSPFQYRIRHKSAIRYKIKRSMLFKGRHMQSSISDYNAVNFTSTSR